MLAHALHVIYYILQPFITLPSTQSNSESVPDPDLPTLFHQPKLHMIEVIKKIERKIAFEAVERIHRLTAGQSNPYPPQTSVSQSFYNLLPFLKKKPVNLPEVSPQSQIDIFDTLSSALRELLISSTFLKESLEDYLMCLKEYLYPHPDSQDVDSEEEDEDEQEKHDSSHSSSSSSLSNSSPSSESSKTDFMLPKLKDIAIFITDHSEYLLTLCSVALDIEIFSHPIEYLEKSLHKTCLSCLSHDSLPPGSDLSPDLRTHLLKVYNNSPQLIHPHKIKLFTSKIHGQVSSILSQLVIEFPAAADVFSKQNSFPHQLLLWAALSLQRSRLTVSSALDEILRNARPLLCKVCSRYVLILS